MSLEQIEEALVSLYNYPQMVGIMGGEPLLHPQFEDICKMALSHFKREKLGLWSAFPKGFEHFRETICNTFGNIFLNDHSRGDIYHQPLLVSAEEVVIEPCEMYYLIDRCWVQNAWSASINPNGAFFCEIAAAWSLLLGEDREGATAWNPKPGWWWATPKDFREQIHKYCHRCGAAMPLKRRVSTDGKDDISPNNYELLKDRSLKIKAGQYILHDLGTVKFAEQAQMAAYKNQEFRDRIAARYDIFLSTNVMGFNEPFLSKNSLPKKSLFASYKQRFQTEF
jgi:hypothetical protein